MRYISALSTGQAILDGQGQGWCEEGSMLSSIAEWAGMMLAAGLAAGIALLAVTAAGAEVSRCPGG